MASINGQVCDLHDLFQKIPMDDVTRKYTNNKIKSILLSLKEQDDDIKEICVKLEVTRNKYHD